MIAECWGWLELNASVLKQAVMLKMYLGRTVSHQIEFGVLDDPGIGCAVSNALIEL